MWIGPWSGTFELDKINIPAGIYLLKVNNKNTRTWCEIMFKFNNKDTRLVQIRSQQT